MRLKLIACNVFFRELSYCAATSPHTIDAEFLELGEHVNCGRLREQLQTRIDAVGQSQHRYDAILLGYGLCGNAAAGIQARDIQLIVPRAHDCCTILLGDKESFKTHFGDNPSTPFTSVGYLERGDYFLRQDGGIGFGDSWAELVNQYGEDDARYIWDAMHPKMPGQKERAVFIDIPETHDQSRIDECRTKAEQEDKEFVVLPGSLRILRQLVCGQWDDDIFQIVPPHHAIAPLYDLNRVISCKQG